MSFNFSGKRALVTGGGSGLGRATALRLAQLGAKVFALSHIQADLDSLKADNPDIEILCVDLIESTKVMAIVKKITPIQLLVNCAGGVTRTCVIDVQIEEFDYTFGVNVKAMLILTQVVARDLIERKEKGSIVNISSIAADRVFPCASTYSATKSAINSYTKTMAVELSPKGIRVNAISPSLIITPMTKAIIAEDDSLVAPILGRTPLGRIPELDDAVNVIVFLLSDESGMINGHILPVDGGYLCT